MLLTNLFESSYGAAAGVETIRQLLHAVKNKKDIDLKVGPEMVPLSYSDARYLLQYFKANRQGGDATAEYFGNANWIEDKLAKRDHTMSPDRLKDIDQERMKSKDYDRMLGIQEDSRPLPQDFVPEPVVTQTIKDLGPGLDPMSNGFYDLAYGKLLGNYLAQNTPAIKKKFNVNWNLAWASQMRELYSREYGGYIKTPGKESVKEYKLEPRDKEDKLAKINTLNALLVDPNTSKDDELKRAIQKRLSQLQVNEDPTPKRRIMDFDGHARYWSGVGEYQDAYGDLYDQLVPGEGKADTVEGELLRAVGKIIYRHGNDGDNFSNSSYEWIEKHVGKFDHLDDMADKVVLYVLSKKGDYTPNNFDWLTVADYGPGQYEKDWEQVGCNNCGGSGEIEYENDEGEEEYEECDSCDGNGWIEQTSESVEPVTEDYKGWKYGEDIEQYDDVTKKFHYAEKDGKKVDMDWSPYVTPTEEQFKTWVDLGMPTRKAVKGIGPLDHNDLEQLMKTKIGTQASLTREDKPMDIELDVLKYTRDDISKAIAIARGSSGDMTSATERIEAMADGLSSHSDVAKVLKIANEAKKDDITSKMDVKTKMALKKQQAKSAGITKGDPVAALAMGLEKDVDRLDKENDQEKADIASLDKGIDQEQADIASLDKEIDQEQADIASQELVDRYHSQELANLKKSIMSLLKK